MKLHYSFSEQWQIIKPIWRILLLALLIQLAGGFISLYIGSYGNQFIDFWFGGAASTFPGFVLGFIWHAISASDSTKRNTLAIIFVGTTCLLLTSFAFLFPLEQMAIEMNRELPKWMN